MTTFHCFLWFYKGYKMLVQCRAKGNEDLICNLLLITPEGCCRSHQCSYSIFLLNSRNKCYKFDLDLTIFSIPFTTGWSWTQVSVARCYCGVLALCKVEVAGNRFSLNCHRRITMGCLSVSCPRNHLEDYSHSCWKLCNSINWKRMTYNRLSPNGEMVSLAEVLSPVLSKLSE